MIDMKTLTDQQKRQLSRLLEMLETEKDPAKPIRWDRKYDNYGKYIVTLGMFEFYCKKAEFLELGFENVEVEEIRDITKEKDKNEGTVAEVTIDKSPKYSKGEWISQNAEVKIVYHSKK